MFDDFHLKLQNWEWNLYLAKNWLGTNDIWWAEDNCSYLSKMYAKEFSDSNFIEAVIAKISIFHENWPKFYMFTKIILFLSIIAMF